MVKKITKLYSLYNIEYNFVPRSYIHTHIYIYVKFNIKKE